MTNLTKSIEESKKRFRKRFSSDGTWWKDPAITPDYEELESFWESEIKRIVEEEREEIIEHLNKDIHENKEDPDIAIINVKLYLDSLKDK